MASALFVSVVAGGMLQVNPVHRPNISDIVARLQEISAARGVNLKAPLQLGSSDASSGAISREPPVSSKAPDRPAVRSTFYDDEDHTPYQPSTVAQQQQSQQQGSAAMGFLNAFKGGAASMFKNVKDASSKVMETVSA